MGLYYTTEYYAVMKTNKQHLCLTSWVLQTQNNITFLTGAFYIIQCKYRGEHSSFMLFEEVETGSHRKGWGWGEFQGARNILFLICVLIRSVPIRSVVKSQQVIYPEDTSIYILFCMYSPVFVFFLISYPSSKCGSKLVTFINHESMYPTVISHFLIIKKKKTTIFFSDTHVSLYQSECKHSTA